MNKIIINNYDNDVPIIIDIIILCIILLYTIRHLTIVEPLIGWHLQNMTMVDIIIIFHRTGIRLSYSNIYLHTTAAAVVKS